MNISVLIMGIVIGAIGALTIEHGWGWILAQYHQRTGK